MKKTTAIAAAIAITAMAPSAARAFCGFYVSGADAKLFNNATQVVMMREGQRTVLSMQNAYQGPPENFAMVVPVPVVLQKENVKTLPKEIFDRVDALTAPRLVEYWEQDPCAVEDPTPDLMRAGAMPPPQSAPPTAPAGNHGVKIEAQFTVGEYEIVVLSAQYSAGLDQWLKENKYKIPDGAEPYLRPYVTKGSKFFVAKVDATKVKLEGGQALLSPLRFHYDADTFDLPIRLGLINSNGTQDLIVNILAKGQRYEVANYDNVTVPTNLDVAPEAKEKFGAFYTALFDRTLEQKGARAVVTEYSWDANSCDPCPTPSLDFNEIATLGADALPSSHPVPVTSPQAGAPPPPPLPGGPRPGPRPPMPMPMPMWNPPTGFVITRLHARYRKDALGEDLVFKAAAPIQGGREFMGANGKLEKGAVSGQGINNFQGRYAVRHAWPNPVTCANPRRGRWGGPPGDPNGSGARPVPPPQPAAKVQFVPRGAVQLASMVREDVPEIGLKAGAPEPPITPPAASTAAPVPVAPGSGQGPKSGGCAGCSVPGGAPEGGAAALLATGALLLIRVRRRV